MKISKHTQLQTIILPAIIGVLTVTTLFVYSYILTSLSTQVKNLGEELVSSKALLLEKDELLSKDISATHQLAVKLNNLLLQSDQIVQNRFEGFEETVDKISDTVGTLDKLSKTDPELLQKYSKVFFLNEHYMPERLVEMENKYLYSEQKPELIHALVAPHLKELLNGANGEGTLLYIKSAYRSFDEQKYIKSSFSITYGAGSANQFSADQGYSEHQLGTTVDLITTDLDGDLADFGTTEAYQWLQNSAHKYGFTLSYPENNPSYIFEPWHWRYVGIKFATFLYDQNKYFYNLEQREIDEYLVDIFN